MAARGARGRKRERGSGAGVEGAGERRIGRGEEIARRRKMLRSFTKQLVGNGKHVPLNTKLDILPQGAPEGNWFDQSLT